MSDSAEKDVLCESQVCTCGAWDDRDLAHAPDCGTYDTPPDLCPTCRETLPCLTCGAGL